MLATRAQALELSIVFSQSLARRRHRPSQASVRSTAHRLRLKPQLVGVDLAARQRQRVVRRPGGGRRGCPHRSRRDRGDWQGW